jgi:hypothetical protein
MNRLYTTMRDEWLSITESRSQLVRRHKVLGGDHFVVVQFVVLHICATSPPPPSPTQTHTRPPMYPPPPTHTHTPSAAELPPKLIRRRVTTFPRSGHDPRLRCVAIGSGFTGPHALKNTVPGPQHALGVALYCVQVVVVRLVNANSLFATK